VVCYANSRLENLIPTERVPEAEGMVQMALKRRTMTRVTGRVVVSVFLYMSGRLVAQMGTGASRGGLEIL